MNKYRQIKHSEIMKDEMQRHAYYSKGNTAVIAGPGSGKTAVLTMKTMYLLENEINAPQGIACITYSREAAREIKDRLNLFGYNSTHRNSFFGTVHAFCISEVLIPFSRLFNHFTLPDPLQIANKIERDTSFRDALKKLRFDSNQVSMTEMNRERKLGVSGMSSIEIPTYDIALQVAREYEEILHSNNLIDFEDIVNYSTTLIQSEEFVRKCLEARFPWLFVDEYQDLGKPLHEIILSLLLQTKIKLFAVGDPDQSIYGFQGAIPDYLKELTTFETRIETIILDKNYRSNQEIIEASEIVLETSHGYLAGTREKEKADFRFYVCEIGMNEQYQLVAEKIIPEYIKAGVPLNEIAVLVGTNAEVTCLSDVFQQNSIPYYISKHEFERTEFIQWLEDCAKWAVNNQEISFDYIWNYWKHLMSYSTIGLHEDLIVSRVDLFNSLSDSIQIKDNLENWLLFLAKRLNLENVLGEYTMCSDEYDNLLALIQTAHERQYLNIESFSMLGKPQNQVTISTRHSCKGLEFEIVVLLGMEEERFPSYYDLQDVNKLKESSRICFVCISRAKRVCILIRSKIHILQTRRGPWGKKFDQSRYWTILEDWQKRNDEDKKWQPLQPL